MQVILSTGTGPCWGVRRAIEIARRAAAEGPVALLGPVVHNEEVARELMSAGARQRADWNDPGRAETRPGASV